jgi:hypothetical protein
MSTTVATVAPLTGEVPSCRAIERIGAHLDGLMQRATPAA